MKVNNQLESIITKLQTPSIIAISGFGGSGKSTFANILLSETNTPVISMDEFIKDKEITDYKLWDWYDYDRLEDEVLIPFLNNKNLLIFGHFDWLENKVNGNLEIKHSGKIILEGLGSFQPRLLKYFSYKIWVDCQIEEAIKRGKERSQNDGDQHWDGLWKQNDLEFYEKYKPKEVADLIIDNN